MSDPETIREFLRRLGHPVAMVGMKPRDPNTRKTHVIWPAEQDDPVDHACWLARQYASIYCNLNPLLPEMLGCDLVIDDCVSVRDAMIGRRLRVLIDIDAHDSVPGTVIGQRDAIRERFGAPLLSTFSGRGFGLIYPVDFPNDPASTQRIRSFLISLSAEFPAVDTSVYGAGRLTRLIGTLNRSTLSRLLE